MNHVARLSTVLISGLLVACQDDSGLVISDNVSPFGLTDQLEQHIIASTGEDPTALILPMSDALHSIPQDPSNPITLSKVNLGRALFHDTAFSTAGRSIQGGSWSCATCHHAAAGFKAGAPQGIGEGGIGFGMDGSRRVLSTSFDAMAEDGDASKPDLQPLASPTILNSAYQDVMLWNGQFGNSVNGIINTSIPANVLMTVDTPKAANSHGLSGLETQAIAGQGVHRMDLTEDSILYWNEMYKSLYDDAFEGSMEEVSVNAGKAIAAFERTVLANEAPFQRWLRGEKDALSDAEKRGGIVFFGKGDCAACHQGPALSSKVGASAESVFMAVGFDDFDSEDNPQIHGPVKDADRMGRGGFSGIESDNLKFKIPQLYNLADSDVFGHGASFSSIRQVLEYKNRAVPQKSNVQQLMDHRFQPLALTRNELDDLEAFITNGLRDSNLGRYQPIVVPSGSCVVVDPLVLGDELDCVE